MAKHITAEQVARVLLDINRLVDLGTNHAERARINPQAPTGPWSKENLQRWEEEFPRLLSMATAGNFSEALDEMHEALKHYRDAKK